MRPTHTRGFTLIELLVVVTIIVILIALLTPALDRAIYEAQMAVCATNLRTIGSGVSSYALHSRRDYPYRSGSHDTSDYYNPFSLARTYLNGNFHTDRPELRPYVPLTKAYADPFVKRVDFGGVGDDNTLWTPTDMYFGFRYPADSGGSFMKRLGDPLRWSENGAYRNPTPLRVLACDAYYDNGGVIVSGHPDEDGVMWNFSVENAGTGGVAFITSASYWTNNPPAGKPPVGRIDRNSVFDDLSVHRLDGLTPGERPEDGRIEMVGLINSSANTVSSNAWRFVARR